MKNAHQKLVRSVIVAIMAAASTVIYLVFPEISLVPGTEHLKLDFSDLPALVAAVSAGPLSGFLVEVLKNLLHLFRSTTLGVGEVMNTAIGAAMISLCFFMKLFARLFRRDRMHGGVYYLSAICALAVTILVGWLSNALLTPVFYAIKGFPCTVQTVMVGVWGSTLLNTIKAAFNLLLFYPLYLATDRAFHKINS